MQGVKYSNGLKHLCPACIHAYGDDCFSYPREERTWITKKIKINDYIAVIKCDRYQKGRRRLDLKSVEDFAYKTGKTRPSLALHNGKTKKPPKR